MNAQSESTGAQAPTRGSGRGRGRGGGRGGNPRAATKTTVAKAPESKIGPNRVMQPDWVKDSILKDEAFVFAVLTGKPGDQQWTFHRPIGKTSLSDRQWVATPTRDINFLLQRRESDNLASWKRRAELAKRKAVLASQKGRKYMDDGQTEVWTFDGSPVVTTTIQVATAAAKAADPKAGHTWINYVDRAVATAEQQFKEALRTQVIPEEWLKDNPEPFHETKGGTLGDVPQKAVGYLNGLSLAAARDKVARVAIGVDKADDLPLPDNQGGKEFGTAHKGPTEASSSDPAAGTSVKSNDYLRQIDLGNSNELPDEEDTVLPNWDEQVTEEASSKRTKLPERPASKGKQNAAHKK